MRSAPTRPGWIPCVGWVLLLMTTGCHRPKGVEAVTVANRWLGPATIAVAPAINLSGSTDFDPDRFADLMASELSFAEGVSVVPVSRVLAALAADGVDRVESPAHAWALAQALGADAIIVFAVTEYDPYDPPSIGITAQLYGQEPVAGGLALDPVALSRQPRFEGPERARGRDHLLAQTQRVFNAAHDSVVEDVKRFATIQDGADSPFGWRRYVVSQRDYMRFCCHATVRALLGARPEAERVGSAEHGGQR